VASIDPQNIPDGAGTVSRIGYPDDPPYRSSIDKQAAWSELKAIAALRMPVVAADLGYRSKWQGTVFGPLFMSWLR
jgi:hypothetical protein